MGLSWLNYSKLSEELDVLDDHTQIASRFNMKYRIYSNKRSGRQ